LYKVLDLFSGAGGMSLGFQQTGLFNIKVAVEKNPHAQLTYKKNHKDTIMIDDILKITDYDSFKREFGRFDVIIGGPPCQGFSNANRQRNHIISQNNSLIKKYVEVIENIRPVAFVMENVRMLKSETHRFYLSQNDDLNELETKLRKETLCLFNGKCPVLDIEDFIFNPEIIDELLLPENLFNNLRLVLRKSYDENKRREVLSKKGKKCLNAIASIPERGNNISLSYQKIEKDALLAYKSYINGTNSFADAEPYMVMYDSLQRLFSYCKELLDNKIIIDRIIVNEKGIFVDVRSITVVEYLKVKLEKYYLIDEGILNAAWFGAPQLRERYIALGILTEYAKRSKVKVELPKQIFYPGEYRTVSDAIEDLEGVVPSFDIREAGIDLSKQKYKKSRLTEELRNSIILHNHVTTETGETALQRFSELDPGQNFHDLKKDLISNTYSKPERTQNSIYLRLDYTKPSGTVTNVRKSMWIHPSIDRAVSVREAARLQTFPDSFIFEGTKDSQYQQIGNAVPPMMAKAIAMKLSELLSCCKNTYAIENRSDKTLEDTHHCEYINATEKNQEKKGKWTGYSA
jgi:DNA (cytosine-5)-methyltransferase 1